MSTFIVPLDGSETTRESLTLGYHMAAALGAKLGVILLDGLGTASSPDYRDFLPASYHNGVRVETYAAGASPDDTLLSWISDLAQPVVVVTARSGSADASHEIVRWIARNSGESVTTLVGQGSAQGLEVRRLLVPLDGSPAAEEILPLATMIALRRNATLGIVRIVSDGSRGDDSNGSDAHLLQIELERDEARAYLDRIARNLRQQGIRATWEVRIGDAGVEIARAAETTAADLILMASSHYSSESDSDIIGVTNVAIRATNIPIIVSQAISTRTI
jgi:nucleotide-binding universal stress UspA family protein